MFSWFDIAKAIVTNRRKVVFITTQNDEESICKMSLA